MADTEVMAVDTVDAPNLSPAETPAAMDTPEHATAFLKRKASAEPEFFHGESAKKPRVASRSRIRTQISSWSPSHRPCSPSESQDHSRSRPRSYSRSVSRSMSPVRRRSPTPPEKRAGRERVRQEEQKRGKRLFGGLLNTLNKSQVGGRNAQATKRRQEIEERQQTKLRQQKIEAEKMRAERGRKMKHVRIREQIVFEEEVMLARHEALRLQARCLKTKTKPHIYYRPWKLTRAQEREIDDQIDDAEDRIDRELATFSRKRSEHIKKHGSPVRRVATPDPYPIQRGRLRSYSRSPSRSYTRSRSHGRSISGSPNRDSYRSNRRSPTPALPAALRPDELDYGDSNGDVTMGENEPRPVQENKSSGNAMDVDGEVPDGEHNKNKESTLDGISQAGNENCTKLSDTTYVSVDQNLGIASSSAHDVQDHGLMDKLSAGTLRPEQEERTVDNITKVGSLSTVTSTVVGVTKTSIEEAKATDVTVDTDIIGADEQVHKVHDESGDVVLEADEDTLIY